MSFLLHRRKCHFTLSMLEDGMTISRRQYDALYKEISSCFSIAQQLRGDIVHCAIRRESEMRTRELFGNIITCPMPTSNHEKFTFYIKSNQLIS